VATPLDARPAEFEVKSVVPREGFIKEVSEMRGFYPCSVCADLRETPCHYPSPAAGGFVSRSFVGFFCGRSDQ